MKKAIGVLLAASVLAGAAVVSPALAGKAADVRVEAYRLLNQGVAAYKRGEYATAAEKLQQSAGMALNNFRAHHYLGLALIGDRRYAEAVEALTVALDLDPNHLMSHVALGDARLKMGDTDEAEASFFLALKLRPEFAAALDGLARVYEARADEDQAIAHYLRAIDSNRGYARAFTNLGDLYLRRSQFDDAVDLLEEAISVRPDFADGLNRLALAYGRLGLHNEAVATIQSAMALEPKDASHPAALGRLQLAEGFISLGEKWFIRSLELDPALPEARTGLAEVARRRGDYELALGQIDNALADERLDALTRKDIEEFRGLIEQEAQRIGGLEQRVAAGEATPQDHAELATIYAGRNLWERAIEFQREAGSDPEQVERMAYMLFRSDRFREAHELYARLASENETAAMRVNDGVAVSQLGDDEAASAAYRRALEIEPDHRLAQLYLGNALLRLGRRDQAVAAYSAFLDLDSRGESAERVRRILEQIAPEALPEKPSPLEPVPQPPAAGEAPGGSES